MAYMDSLFTAHDFFLRLNTRRLWRRLDRMAYRWTTIKSTFPFGAIVLRWFMLLNFERGKWPSSSAERKNMLPYKNEDRKASNNYRPISLLNVDAKLGPKPLAFRIGRNLGSLLHSDHMGLFRGALSVMPIHGSKRSLSFTLIVTPRLGRFNRISPRLSIALFGTP